MNFKRIRELSKKENKRLSKEAAEIIIQILEKKAEDIVRKAAKNSDFAGRATIKPEDIEEI